MIRSAGWVCLVVSLLLTGAAEAEVKLAPVFGNHMVLQRDKPVPVWGTADPDEAVTVAFAGQSKTTTADKEGEWVVRLDPLAASSEPRELVIRTAGDPQPTALTNVVVGDVWVGSGQSNMDLPVNVYTEGKSRLTRGIDARLAALAAETYPLVRLADAKRMGQWDVAQPESIARFSGLLFPFGVALHRELRIPVGLIESAVNGVASGRWVSTELLRGDPAIARILEAKYPDDDPLTGTIGDLYANYIVPMQPFPIRGVLWDQGEGGTGVHCDELDQFLVMGALIRGWRQAWNCGEFPFIYVQKPSGGGCAWDETDPVTEGACPFEPLPSGGVCEARAPHAAYQRELFARLRDHKNVHMVAAYDMAGMTHPINKWGYATRAARVALATAYGQGGVIYGPTYATNQIEGGRILLQFAHTGSGLTARHSDRLQGFAVAGEDRVFHWAVAEIEGDTVVVSSEAVPSPVAVRYAWDLECPWANLFNKDGFPAVTFHTDTWYEEEQAEEFEKRRAQRGARHGLGATEPPKKPAPGKPLELPSLDDPRLSLD